MKMTFEETLKIDVRTKDCLYVEINGITIYIDDSTNEIIVDCWDSSAENGVFKLMTPEVLNKIK